MRGTGHKQGVVRNIYLHEENLFFIRNTFLNYLHLFTKTVEIVMAVSLARLIFLVMHTTDLI